MKRMIRGFLLAVGLGVSAMPALAGEFVPCNEASAPTCGGDCPSILQECIPVDTGGAAVSGPGPSCICANIFETCGSEPQCGGECDVDEECIPSSIIGPGGAGAVTQGANGPCFCLPVPDDFCGFAPQCGGECAPGDVCRPSTGDATADKSEIGAGAATQGLGEPCFCQEPTPPGACCLPGGTCQQLMEFECAAAGGSFAGEGAACAGTCSDPGDYDAGECASPFEDISGSGTPLVLGDDAGQVVPLGFSFQFYSNVHNSVAVTSNGYLTFGNILNDFTEDPIPDPAPPNALIAPFWDDLNPGAGGMVDYQTLGTAPNRRFIAQWTAVPEFVSTGANTLQVLLFEGSNAIEFRYGALSALDGVIGVENASGFIGTAVPRDAIGPGDCLRLTALAGTAEAPALGQRGVALLVLTLLAIALYGLRGTPAGKRR